jgi:hypothetical protein
MVVENSCLNPSPLFVNRGMDFPRVTQTNPRARTLAKNVVRTMYFRLPGRLREAFRTLGGFVTKPPRH